MQSLALLSLAGLAVCLPQPASLSNTTHAPSLASATASKTISAVSTSSGTPLYVASSLPTSPSSAALSNTSLSSCTSRMDGQLPSYVPTNFTFSGNVRRYYIAAEQVTWSYAPTGWDNWLGVPISSSPSAYDAGYLNSSGSFGLEWQKAQYVGYTDASFTHKTAQPSTLGLNGPIVRGEVGDMIEILFVNRLGSHYADVHSMGLSYDKDNEGSLYPDVVGAGSHSTPQPGAAVPPGACYTYKWLVGDASAPAPGAKSQFWAYHPFVNMKADLYAGLVGPVIVYPKGAMDKTMQENREFVLLYETLQESGSWLAADNAARYGGSAKVAGYPADRPTPATGAGYGNQSIWAPQVVNKPSVQLSTTQAPSFAALNGYVFANQPAFEMCVDDQVIWYVYAYGGASHTFHLHGNNFHVEGMAAGSTAAVVNVNDGQMFALTMNASSPGVWGLICHVSDHEASGMQDNYIVHPKTSCPLQKLGSS